jgi:hypothetical protein
VTIAFNLYTVCHMLADSATNTDGCSIFRNVPAREVAVRQVCTGMNIADLRLKGY